MGEEPLNLLTVEDLRTHFFTRRGVVKAVNGVDLTIHKGEAVGLVGESGSGKSVTAKSIMRLLKPPGRIVGGKVQFEGTDLLSQSDSELREIRGRKIAMIMQNPRASLYPLLQIGEQIANAYRAHHSAGKREALGKALQMLSIVGIPDAKRRMAAYPHQLSGGMAQRVMIAIALIHSPQLLIADEPTTALDVTVQKEILDLIDKLVKESKSSTLIITHDLGIVAHYCQRVAVMYAGQIVEYADVMVLFNEARHPYSLMLLKSTHYEHGRERNEVNLTGIDLINLPEGCYFRPRCSFAMDICAKEPPPLIQLSESHWVKCHRL